MNVMTSKVSLGMLARIEAEEFADARRLRRPPATVPKMQVIILSRPFLFFGGIEKAERLEMIPPKQGFDFIWFCRPFEKQQNKLLA